MSLNERARSAVRAASAAIDVRPRFPVSLAGFLKRFIGSLNLWFWAIVGVPTLAAGVYYFGIASPLYMSEAEFVVQGPAKGSISMLAAMFGGRGGGGAEDTQAVQQFILSRDAAAQLEKNDGLRAVLSRPEGDFLTRFPGFLSRRKDFEALYKTYLRFVSVEIATDNGIATLQVKAYRPEDAHRIATALLASSEQLINQMNERARRDALATFQREVDASEARLAQIQQQMTAYRIKAKMLTPESEAKGPLGLLAELNKQKAAAQAQLTDALRDAPRSPQIGLLRTRLASLDKLIADERAKITGGGDSVATAMTEYELLNLQSKTEAKIVAQAVAAREQARLEVQRQQLYLETIAKPNLADYPLYPKRFSSFATVAVSCVLAYGILWLLVAGVREHASA